MRWDITDTPGAHDMAKTSSIQYVCGIHISYSGNNNFHKIVWVLQFACLQISGNRISRYRNWLIFPVDSIHSMKINIPFMKCKISGSEVWHNFNDNFYH